MIMNSRVKRKGFFKYNRFMTKINRQKPYQLIERIAKEYQQILGENLVGIYLHGSLAMGCFHPKVSDIDFLVVVEKPLMKETKKKLIQTLVNLDEVKPAKGFEMSVLLLKDTEKFIYPTPFILHYSDSHREKFLHEGYLSENGKDPDLAAHISVLQKRGKVVYGQAIKEVFSNVPKEDYLKSLIYDINDAEAFMNENPVYFTLNICRTLGYLETGKIQSKVEGGQWGLTHLPERFHDLIQQALTVYEIGMQYQPFDSVVLNEMIAFFQQIIRKES